MEALPWTTQTTLDLRIIRYLQAHKRKFTGSHVNSSTLCNLWQEKSVPATADSMDFFKEQRTVVFKAYFKSLSESPAQTALFRNHLPLVIMGSPGFDTDTVRGQLNLHESQG